MSTPDGTSKPRDLLWEAFVAVHGEPGNDTERGKFNRAVGLLREAGVTPEEYPRLVAAFAAKYTRRGGPPPQPAPMTVPTRVGELRQFLERGPITGRALEAVRLEDAVADAEARRRRLAGGA